MQAFRRGRTGYRTRMDQTERAILGRVVADVAELLGAPIGAEPPEEDEAALPAMDWSGASSDPEDPADDAAARLPVDPALARLLPPASEDADIAAELRRLTEESVRSAKGERLRRVWWDLQNPSGRIDIPADRAMDWAGALTDVRLVVAQRLDITDAEDAERVQHLAETAEDEVIQALATLYIALSWLQDSLIESMLGDLPAGD